jgi:hypothetical protein
VRSGENIRDDLREVITRLFVRGVFFCLEEDNDFYATLQFEEARDWAVLATITMPNRGPWARA